MSAGHATQAQPAARQPSPAARHRGGEGARVITALIALTGGYGHVIAWREMPWASATFSGHRYTVTLDFPGAEAVAAGDTFLELLAEAEFDLRGKLVADATVVWRNWIGGAEPRLTAQIELPVLDYD